MNEIAEQPTTAEYDLHARHKKAHTALRKASTEKIAWFGLMRTARIVAGKLNISDQTVINYVGGMCKDGYLTEAITVEYERLII